MPFVASEACCRKEEEPASERMSMGMESRWAAKMVFMKGMYCMGDAVETERMSIRDVRIGGAVREEVVAAAAAELGVGERRVFCLFIKARARVSAPARAVVGVEREADVVVARRCEREEKSAVDTWWKGR